MDFIAGSILRVKFFGNLRLKGRERNYYGYKSMVNFILGLMERVTF